MQTLTRLDQVQTNLIKCKAAISAGQVKNVFDGLFVIPPRTSTIYFNSFSLSLILSFSSSGTVISRWNVLYLLPLMNVSTG